MTSYKPTGTLLDIHVATSSVPDQTSALPIVVQSFAFDYILNKFGTKSTK